MPRCPIPTREFGVAMYCGGYPVSVPLSPDLHSPLAKPWPGTSFGIPVPLRNTEGRFYTSAKRVVRALPSLAGSRCGVRYGGGKIKGCDIGYALAACSREGADSVDTRTVTAFRSDRCFRSPKSQLLLAERSVSDCSASCPAKLITQPTSDRQNFI